MALSRKFNGKVYHWDSQFTQKSRAEAQARQLRKAGNLARLTHSGGYWYVWVRG